MQSIPIWNGIRFALTSSMLPIGHRILVPLDGSRESEEVLDAILPLVKALGSEITLLRVSDDADNLFNLYPYLQRVQESLKARGVEAYGRMLAGDPAAQIADFANLQEFDLVALSRPARRWWRALQESVPDRVLAASKVPVFVHRAGMAPRPLARILVAVNGTPEGERIIPDASLLARKLNASLHVVQVNTVYMTPGMMGEVMDTWPTKEEFGYLRRVCDHLAEDRVSAEPVSLYGSPGPELIRHANQCGAGLILLAARGRGAVGSTILGNVARELMNNAPCPVLVRPILTGANVGVG